MDPGTVQSGRTTSLQPDPAVAVAQQNDVAIEDHEILRRLIRLLSKSEEDELYAQDARRQPSSSAVHTLHRSKSEGDTTSGHLDRSRSVVRLPETAPLRISRPPKLDLTETFREFERSSTRLCAKLTRLQGVLRKTDGGSAASKASSKMAIHLENVVSYMKQQVDILSQADAGPPSEVHARNLSSAFSSLALSSRALARALIDSREGQLYDDAEDVEVFESLAHLAEVAEDVVRGSVLESKADDSLKRMSGIHFRQRTFELNTQLVKLCEGASSCLSDIIKSLIISLRDRKDHESYRHILRTGLAILFSIIIAMMLSVSVSVDRDTTSLGLASSGIWFVSLASGVAAGITGIVALFLVDNSNFLQVSSRVFGFGFGSGDVLGWIAVGSDVLFLLAATLFSVGLCVFAFSSSQAVAARIIVLILNSLLILGISFLLFLLFQYSRSQQTSQPNTNTNTPRPKKRDIWSSMRNLAQQSIRSSMGIPIGMGTGGGRGSTRVAIPRTRDIELERGLRHRVPSYRRSAPPIIRVTDTDGIGDVEEEIPRLASNDTSGEGSRQSRQSDRTRSRAHTHIHTADDHSRTSVPRASVRDVRSSRRGAASGEDGSDATSTSFSFSFSQSQSHTHMQTHRQTRADLAVPSAQRVSSDSSRSLPALPPDVTIVRCMAYSPSGMFLCIGNASPAERCAIFSTDSPAIKLGELKLTDIALQIEWSEDGENILVRLSHTIHVWNAMPSSTPRRKGVLIQHDSDNLKWLVNSESFLSSKKDILTSFRVDGTPTSVFQIPASVIQDFAVTKDGQRIICLVSNFASTRSERTGGSTQKLVVYSLENKAVEQIAPVGRDALTIVRSSVSPDLLLVNFLGTTPPQVWRYRQNTDSSDRRTSATFLSFKRAMSFKAPAGRFAGYGIFGSADDRLVLSLGEDGDMFVFASDTGQPLRHITTTTTASHSPSSRRTLTADVVPDSGSGTELPTQRGRPLAHCIAWDPDILTFTVCMGYDDGSIWQWKIPFDALGRDALSEAFSVVALGREDSIVIRSPDRDEDKDDVDVEDEDVREESRESAEFPSAV